MRARAILWMTWKLNNRVIAHMNTSLVSLVTNRDVTLPGKKKKLKQHVAAYCIEIHQCHSWEAIMDEPQNVDEVASSLTCALLVPIKTDKGGV